MQILKIHYPKERKAAKVSSPVERSEVKRSGRSINVSANKNLPLFDESQITRGEGVKMFKLYYANMTSN